MILPLHDFALFRTHDTLKDKSCRDADGVPVHLFLTRSASEEKHSRRRFSSLARRVMIAFIDTRLSRGKSLVSSRSEELRVRLLVQSCIAASTAADVSYAGWPSNAALDAP